MTTEAVFVTDGLQQLYDSLPQGGKDFIQKGVLHYMGEFNDVLEVQKVGAASLLFHLYTMVDQAMKEKVEWHMISCKKGCSYCCNIEVYMTLAEAEIIVNYCRENNISIDTEVLKVQEPLDRSERGKHPNSRCVFLKEDNTCGIYEVRPMACRKYIVVSNPKFCDVSNGSQQVSVYTELHTEMILSALANLDLEGGHMSTMILKAKELQ